MAEMEPIDWDRLLRWAQEGDEGARNDLCGKILVRLRPILQYRLWGWSPEEHEDILQNTLMVFVQKLDQIKSNPQHYALAILRNKIGDTLRAQKRDIAVELYEGHVPAAQVSVEAPPWNAARAGGDFTDELEAEELRNQIRGVIRSLSLFCQTLFLAILEERTIREVWQLSQEAEPNLQRSTFDKRVFDCRLRLRKLMKD